MGVQHLKDRLLYSEKCLESFLNKDGLENMAKSVPNLLPFPTKKKIYITRIDMEYIPFRLYECFSFLFLFF